MDRVQMGGWDVCSKMNIRCNSRRDAYIPGTRQTMSYCGCTEVSLLGLALVANYDRLAYGFYSKCYEVSDVREFVAFE